MTYQVTLEKYADPAVGKAVLSALDILFLKDRGLLTINVAERTIASRLTQHLQEYFPGYDVDVEYNRMGEAPKTIAWSDKSEQVYPDIIVHRRMTKENVLVIELKKDSNRETKENDVLKLRAYRRELGYLHALFLRLGVGESAGTVSECQWVDP